MTDSTRIILIRECILWYVHVKWRWLFDRLHPRLLPRMKLYLLNLEQLLYLIQRSWYANKIHPSCADNSIEPQHLKHCSSTASYGTRFRDVKLIPCLTLHLLHANRSIIIVGQKFESGPNRAEKSKCSISSYFISIS